LLNREAQFPQWHRQGGLWRRSTASAFLGFAISDPQGPLWPQTTAI